MNAQEFCYWLQGYMEISGGRELSESQIKIIRDHLDLVFTKVTPTYPFQPAPEHVELTCEPAQTFCCDAEVYKDYKLTKPDLGGPDFSCCVVYDENNPPRSC